MKTKIIKRVCLAVMLVLTTVPIQAQEVVTLADTDIYMFNPIPTNKDLQGRAPYSQCGPLSGGIIVQQYVPQDTVTVYGVALTMRNTQRNGSLDSIRQTYRAVMMQRAAGMPDDNTYTVLTRPLQYVDSISLKPDNIRQCLFRYEFDLPNPYTADLPCVEFYFHSPQQMDVMTDTFYVGREYFSSSDESFFPAEYSGAYNMPPVTGQFWYVGYPDTTQFFERTRTNPYDWGFAFPIIGFRCKPLDEEEHSLLLTDLTDSGVTVQWYINEEGGAYNVRLTSSDGSIDTVVVTTDSIYTFHGLPSNRIYNVQVRKQCHYNMATYDTTVYSPWTTVNTRFALGDTCAPVTNVQVQTTGLTTTVTWDGFANYTDIRLRYGFVNVPQSQWTEIDVTDSTGCTLSGLEPMRAYGVTLKATCGYIEQETQWTAPQTFVTPDTTGGGSGDTTSTGIVTAEDASLALSPNPASGEVTVTVDGEMQSVAIYNAQGQPVGGWEIHSLAENSATLDVSALPAGPYLVRIATATGTVTKKLIVQRR